MISHAHKLRHPGCHANRDPFKASEAVGQQAIAKQMPKGVTYRQAQCLRRVAMDPGSLEWPG